jgi:hypothetical protein
MSYAAAMFFETLGQLKKTLSQLDGWLEAAATYATTKKFDPSVYLGLRLAPDQFAFAKQVQTACDTAKLAAQSLDELRARVKSVVTYLESFSAADFAEAATRRVTQPRWEGQYMLGADYFLEHALPNFYFHTTHAYAILRHNGVPLGKKDFLGALSKHTP